MSFQIMTVDPRMSSQKIEENSPSAHTDLSTSLLMPLQTTALQLQKMNCSYHQSMHQLGDDRRRNGSSGSPTSASIEALEARISVLEEEVAQALRLRSASYYNCPSTSLSEDTAAAAAAKEGRNMQILRIPTKSEHALPGPTLNPASCASGLALLGGGRDVDWISALSLTALDEGRMNGGQGNTHRRNSSLRNEDWDDFDPPQGNQFRGRGSN
jgi:hypothetical protein